ncbi:SDR family NAD(P)-dependent oxidoreductase [Desulfofustis glycolicus]|uniref:NAD(P)-dependent dehydrogenase, short-chain alcohol dehydrogenase family n=1 Tax=Desulfofustis glycolicus DSM 9705 TaxID=1121409 RepID=A0A1M5VPT3_9BACT|nr:SDR family oxidoreductase [Desulfofustis glycolicus]SHH77245.1 NAD(P)-dependent dehydrogenase, short-chain alcohol dehydrogenase family [Desulfofustis glycolicus DSM 9705]
MINPMELENHTIMVTGASSGIGRDVSILLSLLGAKLVLVGRNQEELKKTQELLDGPLHHHFSFDLSESETIAPWMKNVADETGPFDGLVHCAGIQITKPLRSLTSSDIEKVMQVNVNAAFGLLKGFRQRSVCAKPGSIVLIASVMGLVGQAGVTAYSASKGALIALAKSSALELARENIRINCVAPAHVSTEMAEQLMLQLTEDQVQAIKDMHPLGVGTPRDVANAIAFLLADTGKWITGTTLVVDGGYTAH